MRRSLLILLVALTFGRSSALAGEEPRNKSAKPLTTMQAAGIALKAFMAKDQTAMMALAEKDKPDPWLVADELCSRGRLDAAAAFAGAVRRPDTEKLPHYLATQRQHEADPAARDALRNMSDVLGQGKPAAAVEAAESIKGNLDTVVRVRLRHGQGMALRTLKRLESSARALREAGHAAELLGWRARAAVAFHESGLSAWFRSDFAAVLEAWTQRLRVEKERENPVGVAKTLANIGNIHKALGDSAKALSFQGQALTQLKELGDRAGVAPTLANILGNMGDIHQALGAYEKALSFQERALTLREKLGDEVGVCAALGGIGLVHYARGAYAKALSVQERALELSERLGHKRGVAITLANIGNTQLQLGAYANALSSLERALTVLRELGARAGVASTLGNIGNIYYLQGDLAKSLTFHEQALAMKEEIGDGPGAATTLGNIGGIHRSLGAYTKALAFQRRALALKEKFGDRAGAAITLGNIGSIHRIQGAYTEALAFQRRALALKEKLGEKAGMALTLGDIGLIHYSLGDYTLALSSQERALALSVELGVRAGEASALGRIGSIHYRLGAYAKALTYQERALALSEALGARVGVANALQNIGSIHQSLGAYDTALSFYARSLTLTKKIGNRAGAAITLGNIGVIHYARGDYAKALSVQEQTLAMKETLGDKAGAAATLGNIGLIHESLGAYEIALSFQERALTRKEGLGDKAGAAHTLLNIGTVREHLGDYIGAHAAYERALHLLKEAPARDTLARVCWCVADLHLRQGHPAKAVAQARKGVEYVADLSAGLAESEGVVARDLFSGLFDTGCLAAQRAGRPEDLLWFFEQGRAGSLREALGSRAALEAAVIPGALRTALVLARDGERQALETWRMTQGRNGLESTLSAKKAWQEAREAVMRVSARLQRDAKRAAAVTLAVPDDLSAIQARLRAGEALVFFGLTHKEGIALVVKEDGVRMVALPASSEIGAAVDALLDDDRGVSPEKTPALLQLLVEPLELSQDVKRVLISPMGRLGYVPFTLLFPDKEVVYVPSGTTHRLLLEDGEERGESILALGDPDYRTITEAATAIHRGGMTFKLSPLPSTRAEVEAIGTTRLLGKKASESGLQGAIKQQKRWRAVHFACHGLVDPEHPMLSSLALTADAESDGFLTALEVFRMRLPADLVVLSACETGKGKIYKTEGIVGLTRAFMFAGAPRVICSLWKVDDQATKALMIKFYELWNPKDGEKGIGAAAALKRAQVYIKSHGKWRHPHYWAAWVLWGLPD